MASRQRPPDLLKRFRAAQAYGGLSHASTAALFEISEMSVKRIASGDRRIKEPELRALADAVELPYEFFTADLTRLAEIAPRDRPAQDTPLEEAQRLAGRAAADEVNPRRARGRKR